MSTKSEPTAQAEEQVEVDRDETIGRAEALVTRAPATLGLLVQFLDLLEETELDEQQINEVMVLYGFCRTYPELALFMAAIATMRQ